MAPSSWGGATSSAGSATGYLADLLVVDGDPSRDITVLQDRDNLVAILKGGRLFKDALAA